MGAIDKLISLESISLARFKTSTFINNDNVIINIFQNIENEHVYAYTLPENDKYFLYVGLFYTDNNGKYYLDTPSDAIKINKAEHKKIMKFFNGGMNIILNKERIINMAQNKFFNFNLTNE